jgi:hypothetical protein
MTRKGLPAWFLGCALSAAGLPFLAFPATAAGCLSAGEARAAVAAGKVVPLSRILGAIKAATGGEVLPTPQLCASGGGYVYLVNVLAPDNKVTHLTIDAASGAILGN